MVGRGTRGAGTRNDATVPQRTSSRAWATLTRMSFSGEDLAALTAVEEIRIETQAPGGDPHRTIIWVVVDDGESSSVGQRRAGALVSRGQANPAVAIHVEAIACRPPRSRADDPDSIERVSDALRAKYARGAARSRRCSSPTPCPPRFASTRLTRGIPCTSTSSSTSCRTSIRKDRRVARLVRPAGRAGGREPGSVPGLQAAEARPPAARRAAAADPDPLHQHDQPGTGAVLPR